MSSDEFESRSDAFFHEPGLAGFQHRAFTKAMGFDEQMFTPLFALGRMPGWIAQWREMMLDPQTKIGRPRQIYTGAAERDYVPAEER